MMDNPNNLFSEARKRVNRKIVARKNSAQGVWFGLGMMGLIGWSIVLPTLLGAGLGHWLDLHHGSGHSWVLVLLLAGLCLGCINSWLWVAKEDKAMKEGKEKHDA